MCVHICICTYTYIYFPWRKNFETELNLMSLRPERLLTPPSTEKQPSLEPSALPLCSTGQDVQLHPPVPFLYVTTPSAPLPLDQILCSEDKSTTPGLIYLV